ncbi:MAG: nuclear protein [Thelocarpon superellum]|nr:MAG: nuclear protein [Thelocarpon superellum]
MDSEREDDLHSRGSSSPTVGRSASLTPSPAVSVSSDKENSQSVRASSMEKGKGKAPMGPPQAPTPGVDSSTAYMQRGAKRKRLDVVDDAPSASQMAHERELDEVADAQYYDPDQDMTERRAVRKALRDLTRDLSDSRAEYLAPGSTGLVDTLHKANEYFHAVKQTSDATLDSRLLVSTADLSYKKTAQLNLGDAAQGIDVDEFVSKCITFMRKGPGHRVDESRMPTSTQRRGRRSTANVPREELDDEDDSADEGDALDWEFFGRRACYPYGRRPAVPGFLLGPLSLQRRVRAPRARTGRLQRRDPADVVRPEELRAQDLEKAENSNLTVICTRIRDVLVKAQTDGEIAVTAEADDDISEAEAKALMKRHGISDNGGVGLFQFVINPHSFGQTVENLFYVSFLIRDGSVGIGSDSDRLPTLHASQPRKAAEIKEQNVRKHQAIFSLDHQTWRDLVQAFEIARPMIPDRTVIDADAAARPVGARGWYA